MNIRPRDIWTIKYWLHLGVLALVVLGILQLWKGGDMLTFYTWAVSIPLLALGDVVAHTLLNID